MKRSLVLAAAGLLLAASSAHAGPGEVTAVSVVSGPGHALVLIDVYGEISVQDFTLTDPARLVIDINGATFSETSAAYDGLNRGGILNVRSGQFQEDVVRGVLELETLRSYTLERTDDGIRVAFGSDRTFAAWTSLRPEALAQAASGGAQASPYAFDAPVEPLSLQQAEQPRITVTYDSASVADVMAGFAAFSGRSIILGKDVRGTVTAEIRNQPWDVAFQSILRAQGLTAFEERSGIIRVDERSALAATDSTEPLQTKLIRINYARASSLVPTVQSILASDRAKVVADTATNSLVITDVESRIADDSAFVMQLDVPTPQVSIQAKLIFVDRSDIENLGVRYDLGSSDQFFNRLVQRPDPSSVQGVDTDGDGTPDQFVTDFFEDDVNIVNLGGNALSALGNAEAELLNPALNLIFSTAIGAFSLTTFVEALQQVDLADLQAEPVITTADNTEAEILVGEETPVRQIDPGSAGENVRAVTNFVPTGINLRVTPHVTSTGQVLMQVHAENSSVLTGQPDVGFTFRRQRADNQILVNDGETAVIGGLTVSEVTVQKTGIPLLVDLPILGPLFGFTSRRETRRDLLILVTPHIIDDGGRTTRG